MPIPLLIVAGIWTAGVIGAAITGAMILRSMKGKKLAVLGEQAVGKTTLINFLTRGSIPERYEPDLFASDVPGRRVKISDDNKGINIKSLKHLPGGVDDYKSWQESVNEADIVFYLVRVDQLMLRDENTERRVKQDMHQIRKWLKDDLKNYPLFIVGTYCDYTKKDFTTLSLSERSKYKNKVRKMPILSTLVALGGGTNKVRFVPGSLKSKKTTQQLVYDLFGEIYQLDK